MKTIVEFNKDLATDVHAQGGLVVADGHLVAKVEVKYPLVKVAKPLTDGIHSILDKVEAIIPGDWDKGIIEKLKLEADEVVAKTLSEI